MTDWPHAPSHRVLERGTYMVTCGTYLKQHHLDSAQKLTFFRDLLFDSCREFGWDLQAWAILSNHYHWIGASPEHPETLRRLVSKLHTLSAKQLNEWDGKPGRKVWFQHYDSRITFETSYYARLKYVHHNAAHHGVVHSAANYPWCSAAWFERNSRPAFRRMVEQFKTDRVAVVDDFAPLAGIRESGVKPPHSR